MKFSRLMVQDLDLDTSYECILHAYGTNLTPHLHGIIVFRSIKNDPPPHYFDILSSLRTCILHCTACRKVGPPGVNEIGFVMLWLDVSPSLLGPSNQVHLRAVWLDPTTRYNNKMLMLNSCNKTDKREFSFRIISRIYYCRVIICWIREIFLLQ